MGYFQIRTSKNMQNIRHFGRQSTRHSTLNAQSTLQNSGKENNVLPDSNFSKDIVSSPFLSEIDHGMAEKQLLSNQSAQFKEQQRKRNITSQKDAKIALRDSDNNIQCSRHVKVHNKQSRRLLDRSISTINVANKTNSRDAVVKRKFQGYNKVVFYLSLSIILCWHLME